MSLTPDDDALLKRLYGRMDPFEPVEPDDPRYQPVYQSGVREDLGSRLKTHMDFSPVESLKNRTCLASSASSNTLANTPSVWPT